MNKMSSAVGLIDLENVVIKLGLITTQDEGLADAILYCRIPCRNLDLTDRNGTTAVVSLKKSALLMINDNDRENKNNMNTINDIDSVELTYIDIDNDRIQIMTTDDILDSLKCCCCSTEKDKNAMTIKIFAKVLYVSSQQKLQQQHLLSSYKESSDILVEKWQSDKNASRRREIIHHMLIKQQQQQVQYLLSSSVSDSVIIEDKKNVQDHYVHEMKNLDSLNAAANNSEVYSTERPDKEWQKIRHKQQRLLLLRHASRCQYTEEVCPVTPHCASMKKLWEHIAQCKNQQCTVQHCLSSRNVLSHYRRCKDQKCPACDPVRETIRKCSQREAAEHQTTGVTHPSTILPPLLLSIAPSEMQLKLTKRVLVKYLEQKNPSLQLEES